MLENAEGRIAVSTWSLHRTLGVTFPHDLDSNQIGPREETYGPGSARLIDLPRLLKSHWISRIEICSFHLPSRDAGYIAELRDALEGAGVRLQTLLIEAGDLSDPAAARRDRDWISGWVETAIALGAEHARIIAGRQRPSREALDLAAEGLNAIADRHAGAPLRLVTENWLDLLSAPEAVHTLLDKTQGRIGLNGDFGNWSGPGKYDELASIFPRAELCHAKAGFADGALEADDYGRCIDVAEAAGYTGPYTLIFDAKAPDEWAGINAERTFVLDQLAARAAA
ncbi:sugar phosphate isomerase [Devosia geojensis]|uniref:Sugar phosphate isomerase n=1 Tax=Devosia geojensis TaxID=443610 RepID=A0A0F5FUF4_9HYPH|nr:TIM barrel protein [Devosia geojensis]KKB12463.1 sugar phosphate isomerase [Devosia geojensis]